DQEAADRHFRADVEEDRQHAVAQVAVAQRLAVAVAGGVGLLGAFAQQRQAEQEHEQRQQEQRDRQAEIWPLHRLRFGGAIGRLSGRRQRGHISAAAGAAQDQQAAEERRDGGAQRVQRLRQGQPAGGGASRPEQ